MRLKADLKPFAHCKKNGRQVVHAGVALHTLDHSFFEMFGQCHCNWLNGNINVTNSAQTTQVLAPTSKAYSNTSPPAVMCAQVALAIGRFAPPEPLHCSVLIVSVR